MMSLLFARNWFMRVSSTMFEVAVNNGVAKDDISPRQAAKQTKAQTKNEQPSTGAMRSIYCQKPIGTCSSEPEGAFHRYPAANRFE